MAAPTFREVFAEQRMDLPIMATVEQCLGKTYIITGSNTGLGLEAARHLVGLKAAKLILAVRNTKSGEEAKADIEATTKTFGVVEVWSLDLSSYDSVKSFAKRATEQLDRIDGLVENAGGAFERWTLAEGHELCVTVNVLSTLLLAVLLLPKMSETAKRLGVTPHLVIVTSDSAFGVKPWLDKVKDDPLKKMDDPDIIKSIMDRYPVTKLFQVLAIRHLASLLPIERTGVVLNVVNPGLCDTGLRRNGLFMTRLKVTLGNALMGRTAEMGSRTQLHAVVAGKESHGCYVSACAIKENQVPGWATNTEGQKAAKRIWDDIAAELEKAAPGCVQHMLQL